MAAEMQIKIIIRYDLTPVKMAIIKKTTKTNAEEDVEKRDFSYTVGGSINWYSHHVKQ